MARRRASSFVNQDLYTRLFDLSSRLNCNPPAAGRTLAVGSREPSSPGHGGHRVQLKPFRFWNRE
jgi:hypothetical protein